MDASGGIIDLFAGPGGWDLAALSMGLDPLGVEWDTAACKTREAAGLRTLQADVAALDPMDFAPCAGLIASPPCQAFSMAGKGAGRRALAAYVAAISKLVDQGWVDRESLDEKCDDERAHLVLEPLRWALALRPEWIACEQVPPVLPVWEAMAEALRGQGYSTWAGVLSSERYGVPQTRQRAILLASRTREVAAPPATHQRYIPPRKREEATLGLFDAPEPERIVAPEDRGLLPWVSMAEALGWGMTARPYPVIASSRSTGGPDMEKVGGSSAREVIYDEQRSGRWRFRATNDRPNTAERAPDEPAPSLAFGHNPPRWVLNAGTGEHEAHRAADKPAPTLRFGARLNTVTWTGERPATTLRTTDEVHGATYTDRDPSWKPGDPEPSQATGAVRVSLAEALVLQSFPPDYPVQGTQTKQFEQVGNAVPPLLAFAVLRAVIPAELEAVA